MQSSGDDVSGSARVQLAMHDRGPKSGNRLGHGAHSMTRYYDLLLDAALRASGFNVRVLELDRHWNWLVGSFADKVQVTPAYRRLRYLLHITEVATPTADCLELLRRELPSLTQRSSENQLSEQETRMLSEVRQRYVLSLFTFC